jgi:hypothetical protein
MMTSQPEPGVRIRDDLHASTQGSRLPLLAYLDCAILSPVTLANGPAGWPAGGYRARPRGRRSVRRAQPAPGALSCPGMAHRSRLPAFGRCPLLDLFPRSGPRRCCSGYLSRWGRGIHRCGRRRCQSGRGPVSACRGWAVARRAGAVFAKVASGLLAPKLADWPQPRSGGADARPGHSPLPRRDPRGEQCSGPGLRGICR